MVTAFIAFIVYYWSLDIHTCMYIGMYLSSSTPTYIPKEKKKNKKRLLPFLSSWEQCTSREVSYYNKVYREKELIKIFFCFNGTDVLCEVLLDR